MKKYISEKRLLSYFEISFIIIYLSLIGYSILNDNYIYFTILIAISISLFILVQPLRAMFVLIPISVLGKFQDLPGLPIDLGQIVVSVFVLGSILRILINKSKFKQSVLDMPVLLLLGSYLIGVRGNFLDQKILTIFFSMIFMVLVYFICNQLFDSQKIIKTVMLLFTVCALFISALNLIFLLMGKSVLNIFNYNLIIYNNWGGESRLGGLYEQPNLFGQYLVLTIPFCWYFWVVEKNNFKRRFWLIAIIIQLIALFFTQARAAIIGLIIGIFMSWMLAFRRTGKKELFFLIFMLLVGIISFQVIGSSKDLFKRFSWEYQVYETSSELSRPKIFSSAINIILRNPFGVGIDRAKYVIGENIGISEISAHNVILSAGLELGWIAIIALLWIFYVQNKFLVRLIRTTNNYENKILIASLLTGNIALWTHNMAHSSIQWIPVWIFWAIVSVSNRILGELRSF